jgi:hypothetical protein
VNAWRALGHLAGAVLAVAISVGNAKVDLAYLPRPWNWVGALAGAIAAGSLGASLSERLTVRRPVPMATLAEVYLAHPELDAELDEMERQLDAGELVTVDHEEVRRWLAMRLSRTPRHELVITVVLVVAVGVTLFLALRYLIG